METLASHLGGKRLNGPDDLVARSDGVVYFSDVAFEPNAPAFGAPEISFQGLYSLRNGTIHLESNDARFCNGVALSPDERTFYCLVTEESAIDQWDVSPSGALMNRRTLLQSSELGSPDGMTVRKSDGLLFVGTMEDGIAVVDPATKRVRKMHLPRPSSLPWWLWLPWKLLVGDRGAVINLAFDESEMRLLVTGVKAVYEVSTCARDPYLHSSSCGRRAYDQPMARRNSAILRDGERVRGAERS
jgi:hypothetical protein